MKYLILVLLALLLTGCQTEAPETTTPPPSQIITEPATEPVSQPIPVDTHRALSSFDIGLCDLRGIYPMGTDMLLVSGKEDTLLTVLSSGQAIIRTQKTIPGLPDPGSGSMQICENGIAYYDSTQNAIVYLNTDLLETHQIPLRIAVEGNILISPDLTTLYYCSEDAIHALNLSTGIPRMVRRHNVSTQELLELHLDGEILTCQATYTDGFSECLFISTATGEAVYPEQELTQLYTGKSTYFASFRDGSVDLWLTGVPGKEPWMLNISQSACIFPLYASDALIVSETHGAQTELSYLDIVSGRRIGAITPEHCENLSFISGNDGIVWFLATDTKAGKELLYRWSPAWSRVWNPRSYYRTYFTEESPDWDGLLRIAYRANKLGQTYGLRILIGEEALDNQPEDHTAQMEYRIAAYERDLAALEAALSNFPAGFFKEAALGTRNRCLTVNLVRQIRSEGSNELLPGKQFWLNESAYITLAMGPELEQSFYHQLCHIIDNRVMGTTSVYDNWAKLNPPGITYSGSLQRVPADANETWFTGEARAFIDPYSASFPREDRATILEYAMMPGNSEMFASETMQRKLATLCDGIRQAFDLDDTTTYLWEQYLITPEK